MRALPAVALVALLVGLPGASASSSALGIDLPTVVPPLTRALRLPLGFDWSFENVVCREATTARLLLAATPSSGLAARVAPAVVEVPVSATGSRVEGHAEAELVLEALREGEASVALVARLELPSSCVVIGGERDASAEARLPVDVRIPRDPSPSTESPATTASPRSESLLAAAEESSHLRTVELTEGRDVPGPLVTLAVALVGTALVETGRRALRSARRLRASA